jgi:regulation of enolase protein 1 (concanavalin A-like superfamily)
VYWGSTWNSNGSESGRFIYRTLTGDSVLTARVTAPNNQTAALMVRASNSTGSRMVAVRFTNNSSEGAKFWARDSEGWPITQITLPSASNGIQAPYWARITRSGNSFTGEVSPDGVTWTALGSYTVTGMPATARWGFFQGVDQYAAPRWATFSQISVSNAALPPTYAQWLASYGLPSDGTGEGATTASPVSDGIPNIIKYALGISPLVSGYQGRYSVVPATVGESSYLTLSFTRSEPPPDGFTYIPEGSADLATWSGNGWVLLSSTVSAGLRTTVVRDAVPLDTGNRFVRLRISHP